MKNANIAESLAGGAKVKSNLDLMTMMAMMAMMAIMPINDDDNDGDGDDAQCEGVPGGSPWQDSPCRV